MEEAEVGGTVEAKGQATQSAHGPAVGHEVTDADTHAVVKFSVGLVVLAVVVYVVLWGLLSFFQWRQGETRARAPASPMVRTEQERLPPEPRLQGAPGSKHQLASPELEMKDLRDDQERELTSYGWVDRKAEIVHIPIDQAMKLVVEKGLPARPAAEPAPADSNAGRQNGKR